ncbi:hypothetical protein Fmac_011449 [Flemingia macrophylla]|uniref:Uncharacterized protein n=1 Tax=Flemingia macrophylla TaxID=520843 RepID=A0ABD1MMG4_9FABA
MFAEVDKYGDLKILGGRERDGTFYRHPLRLSKPSPSGFLVKKWVYEILPQLASFDNIYLSYGSLND